MSNKEKSIILFDDKQVRRHWNEITEDWYFSVIDVVDILTESSTPKRYWSDLKRKLKAEGSEVYENIVQLKFEAADGKKIVSSQNALELHKNKKHIKI